MTGKLSNMEKGGVAFLVKKKDAKPEDSHGIKIFQLGEDGRADFKKDALLLWWNDIDQLRKNGRPVDAFVSPPYNSEG